MAKFTQSDADVRRNRRLASSRAIRDYMTSEIVNYYTGYPNSYSEEQNQRRGILGQLYKIRDMISQEIRTLESSIANSPSDD